MKKQSNVKRFFIVFLPLILLMVFILFPFYWTFVTSVKPQDELYGAVVTYWPSAVTFEAYAFSRYQFAGRKLLMCTFLCNNMFPTVLLLIPLYTIMRKLGLLYTPTSLVLSYTTFTVPFSVWLLLGFLNDLPMSLEEAALVDGCNRGSAFVKIILPILGPCLVATGVYIFMTSWNEYTFAMMFTNTDTRTIPVALKSLIGQLGVQWDLLTAGGIITIIPVCIMFFFAQKRLVEGLTAGAVKG